MPIANSNIGSGFRGALAYALQEGKKVPSGHERKVMQMHDLYGRKSKEMARLMREVAQDNTRVKKPVLHLRVNFDPTENLPVGRQMGAVKDIMKGVGIDDNRQYIIVKHKDKKHEHYHIIANRIDYDGKCLDNKHMNRRLIVQADRVEKERGLKQTKGRTLFYDPSSLKGYRNATGIEKQIIQQVAKSKGQQIDKREGVQAVRNFVQGEVKEILTKGKISRPEALKRALAEKGIDVKFSTNKNGIYGISFRAVDVAVKGSAIGYKWKQVKMQLEGNRLINELQTQPSKEHLQGEQPVSPSEQQYSEDKQRPQATENKQQSKEQPTQGADIEAADRFIERLNAFKADVLQQHQANEKRIAGTKVQEPVPVDLKATAQKQDLKFQEEGGQLFVLGPEKRIRRKSPEIVDLDLALQSEFKQQDKHYKDVLAYIKVMGKKEKKVSLIDWFTGKAFEKRAFNKAIRQEKAEVEAPAVHVVRVGGKIFDLTERMQTPTERLKEQKEEQARKMKERERQRILQEKQQQRKESPNRGRGLRM